MSSSAEARLLVDHDVSASVTDMTTTDLRSGEWTRYGTGAVLGDRATETSLSELAARTQAAARTQGYTAGWAEGRQRAAAEAAQTQQEWMAEESRARALREQEHATAMRALNQAISDFELAAGTATRRIQEQATQLAFSLVAELLMHEVNAETPTDVCARAIRLLPEDGIATLRLHPSIAAIAEERHAFPATVTVAPDNTLQPSDVVVELSQEIIDLRLDQAAERLRRVLT